MITHFEGPVFSGGGFIGGGLYNGPSGKTFFVNSNGGGTDDVDVPWWDVDESSCFSSLEAGIDACVSGRGDTVWVKRGSENVAEILDFNKSHMSVITQRTGLNPRARGEFCAIYSTTITDGPCAVVSASGVYIEGLGFASANAERGVNIFNGGALRIGNGADNLYGAILHQCRFPKWGLDQRYGISIDGTKSVSNCLINACEFEGAFLAGMHIQGAVGHLQISNCIGDLATWLIQTNNFSDVGVNSQLEIGPGNRTITPTRAINQLANNVVLASVFGNWWGAPVATAYSDTVDNMETDGYLCSGNHYSDEETDDD